MVDAIRVKRSIYFATLQGYVIFETKLYIADKMDCTNTKLVVLSFLEHTFDPRFKNICITLPNEI